MANGKIPNFNNKFYGDKLVEVTFPDSTSSLGFDEYNAVLNNVNSSVSSSIIMDADYALNARIPTNNDRLLSGTAQRMEIQDSNYSSVAWTSPRYVGSQTVSATYNDYTPSGSSVTFADGTVGPWKGDQVFDEYPGDETFRRGNPLGKVPAIDLYSTHFVLFDRIQIDEAFADGDIFHCLYLIDDQGNKQPLTYRNKNLVDLQRIFVKGSNAEVLFLGQNNQEVLDEYPILEVGRLTSTRASFTNDVFKLNGTDYEPNFISTETAVSNAYIRHTFINDRQTDYTVRFVPSAFNVESLGGDNYRLTYSNTDIRNSIINLGSGISSYPFRHVYYRYSSTYSNFSDSTGSIAPSPTLTNGISYDGSSSLNMSPQDHDSKFDPFYFLTWNPQTSKIFEGTLLEQKVEWNLFTPDHDVTNPQFFPPVGYPSTNVYSMGSVSNYESTWSPLKINDTMFFGKFPINQSVPTSFIGDLTNQPTETIIDNFRSYYEYNNNTEVEIININYPFSQSYGIVSSLFQSLKGYDTFYDDIGNIDNTTSPQNDYYWKSNGYYPFGSYNAFLSYITPNQWLNPSTLPTGFGSGTQFGYEGFFGFGIDAESYITSGSVGSFPFYLDGIPQQCYAEGAHTLLIHKNSVDGIDRSDFLSSLSHGDIIEFQYFVSIFGSINLPTPNIVKFQILAKPTYNNTREIWMCPIQYLPVDGDDPILKSGWNVILPPYTHRLVIKNIYKYRAPYIDVKLKQSTQTNISSSINSKGSTLSVVGVNTHEQYITSQFLEGSGVGALIPENYDPKLREQLPDIINKTGIDINSLT
jgi:hypothetical protein